MVHFAKICVILKINEKKFGGYIFIRIFALNNNNVKQLNN